MAAVFTGVMQPGVADAGLLEPAPSSGVIIEFAQALRVPLEDPLGQPVLLEDDHAAMMTIRLCAKR